MNFSGLGQMLALQYRISSLRRLGSLHGMAIESCWVAAAAAYNAVALLDLLFKKLAPLVTANPISRGSKV